MEAKRGTKSRGAVVRSVGDEEPECKFYESNEEWKKQKCG